MKYTKYRKRSEWNQHCATVLAGLIAYHGNREDALVELIEEAAKLTDAIDIERRSRNLQSVKHCELEG